jgi:hypothetical protein
MQNCLNSTYYSVMFRRSGLPAIFLVDPIQCDVGLRNCNVPARSTDRSLRVMEDVQTTTGLLEFNGTNSEHCGVAREQSGFLSSRGKLHVTEPSVRARFNIQSAQQRPNTRNRRVDKSEAINHPRENACTRQIACCPRVLSWATRTNCPYQR